MDFTPDTTFEEIDLSSTAYSVSKLSSILEDLQESAGGLSQSDKLQLIQSIQQQVVQSFSSQDILTQDNLEDLKNDIIDEVVQEVMQQVTSSGNSFVLDSDASDDGNNDEIDFDDLF